MNGLNELISALKVTAHIFHNGQYCGAWVIDTSGSNKMNFHVVSKGQCVAKVGDQIIKLFEGDAIFFPNDTQHYLSNSQDSQAIPNEQISIPMTHLPDETATGLVCGHFEHQHPIFNKLMAQMPNVIVVRCDDHFISHDIINLMMNESRRSEQNSNLLLNRLADCLFYSLMRDHTDTSIGVFAALAHPRLTKPINKIHSEHDWRPSLEGLAREANMSRSAFSALFKQVMQQTPNEYISQWRMTQAYRWLADERITTYEAALRTGYESESSFSKAFKRIMGIGPGEARSEYKNVSQ